MLKKRLIFTLLIDEGIFQLSRNFTLQGVGNLDWLAEYYNFDAISRSVDEFILLNVKRNDKNIQEFGKTVIELSKRCFMPIAAGGGIRSIEDAYQILDAGADKLIVNTPVFTQTELITQLVKTFGSQCVVASIDYKKKNNHTEVFISDGSCGTGMTVENAVVEAEKLGVGEIYLTSIDRDGTGQGFDLETLSKVVSLCQLPIIASGGVGHFDHFTEGMLLKGVAATSTANIFNFIANGLTEARNHIQEQGIELALWNFDLMNSYFDEVIPQ
jgi:cyclase